MATKNTLNKMRMLLQHSELVNRTEHKETRPKKHSFPHQKHIRPIVQNQDQVQAPVAVVSSFA